jgi:transposase
VGDIEELDGQLGTTIGSRHRGAIGLGWDQSRTSRDGVAKKARTLPCRFERREDMILRFTTDLRVPFTNNQAERDARPTKIQLNTSGGCWRGLTGLAAGKGGLTGLDALTRQFTTGAWLPPGLSPATPA